MKSKYILLLILIVAAFLRLYQLSNIPGSLNQDEAAIGYNAYALFKTGADEHGKFLPLALQSFGDWKLPFYEIITIPFIVFFGLTEEAVRLPSAISGIIGVFLIFKITELLFKDRKIALFAAFFYAFSPWSIYFSRAAYEVNLGTTLFLAGFYLLIRYLAEKQKSLKTLVPAAVLFGLTLFTYHSFILFTPLFILGMLAIFYRKIILDKWTIISVLIMLFFISISFITLSISGSNKVSTLSILNDPNIIYNRADKLKTDKAVESPILKKLLYNKYAAVLTQFGQNYIGVFSPSFLFDKGGEKLQHNLGYFANFYLLDALLLVIGVLSLFWYREKTILFLLPWFLVGPIPSSLTTDTPNSTRLFLLLPLATIVMAYGAGKMIDILRGKRFYYLSLGIIALLYIINIIYFLDGYFVHFNFERVRFWRYGNKQAVALADKYPTYNVVMRGPEDFHYIYFLFYEKYDPAKFIKEVEYYPMTSDGFLYVKSFARFSFVDSIDYTKLQPDTIYIDDQNPQNLEHTINLPSGEPILGYTISGNVKK